ncbi:MAG: hypothetical protein KatS3mg015_2777 [Fimbriimonadales bacterium]|nr:MAG: hypothetical protein KatS3mg015_2777 [Fimbriimonadales bacterium]
MDAEVVNKEEVQAEVMDELEEFLSDLNDEGRDDSADIFEEGPSDGDEGGQAEAVTQEEEPTESAKPQEDESQEETVEAVDVEAATAEPTESTAEPSESDELRRLREQVAELTAKLRELTQTQTPAAQPQEPTQTQAASPQEAPQDFLGEVEPEDLLTDKEAFNQVLARVYEAAKQQAKAEVEAAMRSIPLAVQQTVQQYSALQDATRRFYEENPDLKQWSKAVAAVAEELQARHPEWDLSTLFAETEREARKRLQLPKQKGQPAAQPQMGAKPKGFARAPSSRPAPQPQLDGLAKELMEMLEV